MAKKQYCIGDIVTIKFGSQSIKDCFIIGFEEITEQKSTSIIFDDDFGNGEEVTEVEGSVEQRQVLVKCAWVTNDNHYFSGLFPQTFISE